MQIPSNAIVVVPSMVAVIESWLPSFEAESLWTSIVNETSKTMRPQLKFNKGRRWIDAGHRMSRYGDEGVTYNYRDKQKPVHAMTPTLVDVRDRVASVIDWHANCCVINTYSPTSSLYPHSDGKYIPQLGENPTIVAVSFGVTRTFVLHPYDGKKRSTDVINVPLAHGDLLIMHGECDTKFHHSIPEEPLASGDRLSLTFRLHVNVFCNSEH